MYKHGLHPADPFAAAVDMAKTLTTGAGFSGNVILVEVVTRRFFRGRIGDCLS